MAKEKKDNKTIYAGVCITAATITILLLELYSSFELNILDYFNVSGAMLYVLRVIMFFLHWALFSGLFFLLRYVLMSWSKYSWEKKNKGYLVGGEWLHIHDKENVKIGVVEIKQDFYDLTVSAENILPQSDEDKRTRWHYIGSEFKPNENAAILLMGCYYAQRENEASKQGIHLFRNFSEEGGKIVKMSGDFGDAINIVGGQKPVAVSDKTGKILLFRMTDEIRDYIGFNSIDGYKREKLRWIINEKENEAVINSEFVKALKKIYYRNEFQRQWSELKKFYEEGVMHDFARVENAIYDMLAYAMYADNEVDRQETEMLRTLTGLKRNLADHHALSKEKILADIKEVLTDMLPRADVLNVFKLILNNSCRAIILCNSRQADPEEFFLREMEDVIKQVCQKQPC